MNGGSDRPKSVTPFGAGNVQGSPESDVVGQVQGGSGSPTHTYGSNVSGSQVHSFAVGDQARAITINERHEHHHHGLSFAEAERLFGLLFEQNFPKLRAEAAAEARRRVDKFAATFRRVAAAQQVTEEQLGSFAEPDIQFMLNSAVQASARRDGDELREILSRLIVKRLGARGEELMNLVLGEAVLAASKLTPNQLRLIALCFLTMYADWFEGPVTWTAANNFLQETVTPFMGTKLVGGDLLHIEYTGCATLGRGPISHFDMVIERRYPVLFEPYFTSQTRDLKQISSVIEQESPILRDLSAMSRRASFYALHPTTVGAVLAVTIIEQATGKRLPIDKWLR